MVSRQDVRNFNEEAQQLQEAIDEMDELYEAQQNPDVTVDPAAFANAQEKAKNAVAAMVNKADDAVDRTDVFEPDEEGASDVTLPNSALQRSQSTTLPNPPSN